MEISPLEDISITHTIVPFLYAVSEELFSAVMFCYRHYRNRTSFLLLCCVKDTLVQEENY